MREIQALRWSQYVADINRQHHAKKNLQQLLSLDASIPKCRSGYLVGVRLVVDVGDRTAGYRQDGDAEPAARLLDVADVIGVDQLTADDDHRQNTQHRADSRHRVGSQSSRSEQYSCGPNDETEPLEDSIG